MFYSWLELTNDLWLIKWAVLNLQSRDLSVRPTIEYTGVRFFFCAHFFQSKFVFTSLVSEMALRFITIVQVIRDGFIKLSQNH